MTRTIKALAIDLSSQSWDDSKGFVPTELPMPELDEANNPEDAMSVILKIHYAGICGTDRGLWYRQSFKELFHSALEAEGKQSRIIGHEFAGTIEAMGSQVARLYKDPDPQNKARVEVGSMVTGDSHITCGRCYQCRIGEEHVCRDQSILGVSTDGIFAEYVKIPAKNLWPIDQDRIRPEIAAIMDPFGNAVHACTKVDLRGQRVAIFGVGPIGMFSILVAKNFGAAKVIAVDVNPTNLEIAKKLGADETILIGNDDGTTASGANQRVIDEIMQYTYGKGVDVAMEMAGPAPSVINAIESTRLGGEVILFGLKDGDVTLPNFSHIIVNGLTIHGIIGRQIFDTWQTAQRLLSKKANGIQDEIWKTILREGEGTMLDFHQFDPEEFENKLNQEAKLIFKV